MRCSEEVWEAPGYWHSHSCANKAKFIVRDRLTDRPAGVCGVHVKWYRRVDRVLSEVSETGAEHRVSVENDSPSSPVPVSEKPGEEKP